MKYDPEKRFANVPDFYRFSKEWTPVERLRVVSVMAGLISMDVPAGNYSAVGRPNGTSIQHLCAETAEVIEESRAEIERLVWEYFNPVEAGLAQAYVDTPRRN